jgi:hypothetical protein
MQTKSNCSDKWLLHIYTFKLSLRFAKIDASRHQSFDPIPIPINRYNVLFIRNDKLE